MSDPLGRMAVLLMTDIEGSQARWEADSQVMGRSQALHDELARAAIVQHGGRIIKSRGEGDSFFATFHRADEALAAACALQLGLQGQSSLHATGIRVRAAVHAGEQFEERGGDIFGAEPGRCARICKAAWGGQILVSEAVVRLAGSDLPEGVSLRALGLHRFKDVAQPMEIHQLCHPDLPADFPPLAWVETTPNNLPVQLTSFIGREHQTTAVADLLVAHRLVTLTGVGGCGKTRLALHVAGQVSERFPDGVWFVDLSTRPEDARLPETLADMLHVRDEPGRPMIDVLADYLRPREVLLLLDNCEHVISACAVLAEELVSACPRLRVLATSREMLEVPGEMVLHVPPLSLPRPRAPVAVDDLAQFEAIRLFVERAQTRQPSFALSEGLSATVEQICRLLDGLPLAIELAAARIDVLPVRKILDRLADRFALLVSGPRTAADRHRTLLAAVQWSYDLLRPEERALFNRLTVFAGSFTLGGAEHVAAGLVVAKRDVLNLLTGLIHKSLVEHDVSEGRFRMLETLRSFGRARLVEEGALEAVMGRYADYFVALAETARADLDGPDQEACANELQRDHDDLAGVLAWSVSRRRSELGLRLVIALERYWIWRGHVSEARQHLTQLLGAVGDDVDAAILAGGYRVAGNLAYHQGDTEVAGEMYLASLALLRQSGDSTAIPRLLNNLSLVARGRGDLAAARTLLEESLALRSATTDRRQTALVLTNLGLVAWDQGDYPAARRYLEESVALDREREDLAGLGASLISLGVVALDQGDLATALACQEESLAVRSAVGDREGVAETMYELSTVLRVTGEHTRARELLEESLALAQQLGDEWIMADVRGGLGQVALEQGELRSARGHFQDCKELAQRHDRKARVAAALNGLGLVALAQGDLPAAWEHLKDALAIRREIDDRRSIADSLCAMARVKCVAGETELAASLARQSLVMRYRIGDRGQICSLEDLAMVAVLQGRFERALRLAAAAQAQREAIGTPLPPNERAFLAPLIEQARQALGPAEAERAWAAGRALGLDDAVEEAVAMGPAGPIVPPEPTR